MVDTGVCLVAWDRGMLAKRKLDPIKHASLYFGEAYAWRAMSIGVQGAAEYRSGDELDRPSAVYPVWEYGEDIRLLEELLENPLGENESACSDTSIPGDERPVFGQEHRVVITNLPDMNTGPGRTFATKLIELQEDYPDVKLHIHGLYSYRVMFGSNFFSVDIDPRSTAQKGNVFLPIGKMLTFEQARAWPNWVTIIGFKPVELAIPAMRCQYNIKSALWAAENWDSVPNVRLSNTRKQSVVDTTTPDASYQAPETKSHLTTTGTKVQPGDKVTCNSCTLASQCKHYRDGAVCSLPHASPKTLSDQFNTRDADRIIDGLKDLTVLTARRLERGLSVEEQLGDIDPEVTKLSNQLFKQGTEMAKLIDPNLRGGAKVQVNVGQAGQVGVQAQVNPKILVASIVRELEDQGVPRDQITPDMMRGLLEGRVDPQQMQQSDMKEIEGTVIEG
jgi:hypothetical protein